MTIGSIGAAGRAVSEVNFAAGPGSLSLSFDL